MRHSLYNRLIKLNSDRFKYIIYNTYSTALGLLDDNLLNIYNNISNLDTEDNNIKSEVDMLLKNGFIIKDDVDEFSKICVEEKMDRFKNSSLNLTIAPTLACNMRCVYCYEEKKPLVMNEKVCNLLLNFTEKLIKKNNFKTCSVRWYGGEPLLELEVIRRLSISLQKLCEENSIEYTSSIVTNGVLLTEETALVLKNECKVESAQITIDGLKTTHNKNRPLVNGKDSFNTIIENINEVKDIIKIYLRINIDKNNKDQLIPLINYLIDDMNFGNKVLMYPYPIIAKNTSACNVNKTSCILAEEFGDIDSEMIRLLYNKGAKESICGLIPYRSPAFCTSISRNSFVIDPEGFLYTCWDFIGIKERSIGNIVDELDINNEYSKWLLLDIPRECKMCTMLPLCKGGCPSSRLHNNNVPCCNPSVMNLNEKLKIIYDDFKKSEVEK